MHRDEREVLGMESKKQRVSEPESELETEESLDLEVFEKFQEKMESRQIARGSVPWKLLFDEVVTDRLREEDPSSCMREMRRRKLAPPTRVGASGSVEPDGADEVGELGGEDGS